MRDRTDHPVRAQRGLPSRQPGRRTSGGYAFLPCPVTTGAMGLSWQRRGGCWSYIVRALGNRVWKSSIPTQPGVTAMRAMGFPRSVPIQAGPFAEGVPVIQRVHGGLPCLVQLDDGAGAARVPAARPGAVFHEGGIPRCPRLPPGAVDARDRRCDVSRPQVDQERLGGCRLPHDPGEQPGHRLRERAVDESRHDGVLKEAAFQDDRLPAAQASLGQPAPLAGRVCARLVRRVIPGRPGSPQAPRADCPQLVHGSGPDGVILGELAECPRVFPRRDSQSSTCLAVVVLPEPIIPAIKISRAVLTGQG